GGRTDRAGPTHRPVAGPVGPPRRPRTGGASIGRRGQAGRLGNAEGRFGGRGCDRQCTARRTDAARRPPARTPEGPARADGCTACEVRIMRIVITGATGNLGSAVTREVTSAGANEVIGV